MKRIEDLNFYEILDTNTNATYKEIREAYQSSLQKYGPDSIACYGLLSEEERVRMLEKIEEAYKTLSDQTKREDYDLNVLHLKKEEREISRDTDREAEAIQKKLQEVETINGGFLKTLREAQDITLDEISKKTKIRICYLQAIENDDYKVFTAEIFLRGFLKSYIQCLGLKPDEILKKYSFIKPK
jgi:DnaJ-class molecular chaperone